MKRKLKMSIPPRYILAALSVLCAVLILVSFKFSDSVAPMKSVVGDVMSPMQKGINKIGTWIHSKQELLVSVKKLTKENKELKEQLDSVSYQNKQLLQDKYELANLREQFQLSKKYATYPKVGARVIGRDANNWNSTITIDKGSKDGIKKDMNVISGNGLVGIVTAVGKHSSQVRLIIDDDSNVYAMFLTTGESCKVKGNLSLIDKGLIDVKRVSKDAKVKTGAEIVTSNYSSKFLQGILIGYLEDLKTDQTNLTKSGTIRPVVDFDNLDIVLVITELKENAD
ncbi:rod shape-determining protein MreC [Lachnospiraceae bacterium KM106-2]|nr:rod shape-determining protein MreC [Lachnospiraceae bacterium KM106-2]